MIHVASFTIHHFVVMRYNEGLYRKWGLNGCLLRFIFEKKLMSSCFKMLNARLGRE